MIGPRDLFRGRKPFERAADPKELVAGKSYFIFKPWGQGFALTVHRRGCVPETILAETEGELNRHRRRFSDEGLIGINGDAA